MQRANNFSALVRFSPSLGLGCLAFCLWTTVQHVDVQADVVGHWRLEPGNDFLTDSVGNAHLETNVGPVESVSHPAGDRGVFFPKELPGVGSNLGAARFGPDVGELISEDAPLIDNDFTIELFANVHNFSAGASSSHFVAQLNPAHPTGAQSLPQFGWTLHAHMNGWR